MKKTIFHQKLKIIRIEKLGKRYFRFAFESPDISSAAVPGQFVEIKTVESDQPLLRRPLGIHRVKGKVFGCLCEIVGKGTELLSKRKVGDYLDVIGPLGNGFNYKFSGRKITKLPIIVAGGIGVAPLLFLADKTVKLKPLVLIGAKTKDQITCEKEFKDLGCSVKIATDDGSRGFKGYISKLLEKELRIQGAKPGIIYACGPKPMLKEIAKVAHKYKVPAEVSLEEHMACGIGACLGCVVDTKDGLKRVCKEGPVFKAEEIIW